MNTPPRPLPSEHVDTLLSAELDGEFDRAAADLDLNPAEARDRLAETPGIEARRRALTQARDLIATRPPLPSTLEDRLIAAVLATDQLATARERRGGHDRSRRILIAAGSVAAAIAVVVGVSHMHSPDSAKSSADAARAGSSATGAKPAHAPTGTGLYVDFGDVTNGSDFRTSARRALVHQRSVASQVAGPEANTATAPQPAAASGITAAPGLSADKAQSTSAAASATFGAVARSCTAAVQQRYAISSEPAIVGTGRISGAPVVILVFERGNGTDVAYIVRSQACALVRKQLLG